MPVQRTLDDHLSVDQWKKELVFAFGDATVDDQIPADCVFRIPSTKFIKSEKLFANIQDEQWKHGFTLIASEETGIKEGPPLLEFQMSIAAAYYRNHHFDNLTPFEPNPIMSELLNGGMDPTRCITRFKNMPWLLRYPIIDKLMNQRIGLPTIILMPGPSLQKLKGKLKEIAKRCLVICIARTLKFCLDEGVEPDFVVQYDTNLEQKNFYEDAPMLRKTILLTLSSANIASYAWKFRGIFMRASFRKALLKNENTLRDGPEGSMLACMGLAETLFAPEVWMAGCDQSWVAGGTRYNTNNDTSPPATKGNDYRLISKGGFKMLRRDGVQVCSELGYIAVSVKAGEFADTIGETAGSRFFTTSDETLLSPKQFPLITHDEILARPRIDRDGALALIDKGLAKKEDLDLDGTLKYLKGRTLAFRLQETLTILRQNNVDCDHPLYDELMGILSNVRSPTLPSDANSAVMLKMIQSWTRAVESALKVAVAYKQAQKSTVPTLCMEQEYDAFEQTVDGFFPKESLDIRILESFTTKTCAPPVDTIMDTRLADWLKEQEIVFISRGVAKYYEYFFELYAADNVLTLPDFSI